MSRLFVKYLKTSVMHASIADLCFVSNFEQDRQTDSFPLYTASFVDACVHLDRTF